MEFANIKRLRNIRGCIIAEKINGHRCEIPTEVIQDAIDTLDRNEPKVLGVNEITSFLLKQRLINLLTIEDFEMYV